MLMACSPVLSQTAVDSIVCSKCIPIVVVDTTQDTVSVVDSLKPTIDTVKVVARVDTVWKDSSFVSRVDTIWKDSVFTKVVFDTTGWRDSVIDFTPIPVPVGHRPAGVTKIIGLEFAAAKLPQTFVTGPNATYGISVGKAQAPHQSNKSIPTPYGYGHRCTFGLNAVTGTGPGCFFEAKENLPTNTSGNTAKSYRIWYETGKFKFGGANGELSFQNMGSDGFKLFGYWGGMCPGNKLSDQLILWGAPAENRDTVVTSVTKWRAQIRWNAICVTGQAPQPWPTIRPTNWPTFTAGVWHTYEVLLDAGDINTPNGSITLWIDGVQMAKVVTTLRTTQAPRGWFGRHWNPVLNGKKGLKKTRVDVLDIDEVEVYVGQPLP